MPEYINTFSGAMGRVFYSLLCDGPSMAHHRAIKGSNFNPRQAPPEKFDLIASGYDRLFALKCAQPWQLHHEQCQCAGCPDRRSKTAGELAS